MLTLARRSDASTVERLRLVLPRLRRAAAELAKLRARCQRLVEEAAESGVNPTQFKEMCRSISRLEAIIELIALRIELTLIVKTYLKPILEGTSRLARELRSIVAGSPVLPLELSGSIRDIAEEVESLVASLGGKR